MNTTEHESLILKHEKALILPISDNKNVEHILDYLVAE